jgi:hypothetical protein
MMLHSFGQYSEYACSSFLWNVTNAYTDILYLKTENSFQWATYILLPVFYKGV